jgi:hypothetical protein
MVLCFAMKKASQSGEVTTLQVCRQKPFYLNWEICNELDSPVRSILRNVYSGLVI